jgi:hypothetical protein
VAAEGDLGQVFVLGDFGGLVHGYPPEMVDVLNSTDLEVARLPLAKTLR